MTRIITCGTRPPGGTPGWTRCTVQAVRHAKIHELAAAHSVTASVLVQVLASAAETEEFLALAGRTPLLAGVMAGPT